MLSNQLLWTGELAARRTARENTQIPVLQEEYDQRSVFYNMLFEIA